MAVPSSQLHVVDYVILACVFGLSIFIGIYHAFTGGKQKTIQEFFLANRNMSKIPVAFSLLATFHSAIFIMGVTAENYIYGYAFCLYGVALLFVGFFVVRFFIPMYFRLEITSTNEYLEMRFNKVVRSCGYLTFLIMNIIYMGIALYAPSLALNVITGLSLWGSLIATGLVCTFYTTIGGMKAVVWTDVLQTLIIVTGLLGALIVGCRRVGGLGEVLHIAQEGHRIYEIDFRLDPTIRHSFWSLTIGGIFAFIFTFAVNQAQVQRYLSCANEKAAKISVCMSMVGSLILLAIASLTGLTMYAYYAECDPLRMGSVAKPDQMIIYFITDIFSATLGLTGVFTASIFSASLSTMSSVLNALATVTTEDFIKIIWKNMNEARLTTVTKIVAMMYGLITIFVAYVLSLSDGGVLQFAFSLFGVVGAPFVGLFSLGMFFSWTNSKGALVGYLCGIGLASWICIGSIMNPQPNTSRLPLSIDGCELDIGNVTTAPMVTESIQTTIEQTSSEMSANPITQLYGLSYAWFGAVGWCTTMLIGLLVSFITGPTNPEDVDPKLFLSVADAMYCCFPESCKRKFRCGVPRYYATDDESKQAIGAYAGETKEEPKEDSEIEKTNKNQAGEHAESIYLSEVA